MGLQEEETDRHRAVGPLKLRMGTGEKFWQGDKVPQRLPHLLPVDGDHIVMDPVMHALSAARSDVLGNLALVVREHQVHTAAVDVELLS